jgi:hypothetical protein
MRPEAIHRLIEREMPVRPNGKKQEMSLGQVRGIDRETKIILRGFQAGGKTIVRSAILDPGHYMLGQRIAVLLKHHHVAIAYDPAIAEINEIRLRTVLVEPLDDGFVELARMVDVIGPGHH